MHLMQEELYPEFDVHWGVVHLKMYLSSARFHRCLMKASTSAAKRVGRIFFNYLHTKCFVFDKDIGCTQWSTPQVGPGSVCLKFRHTQKAVLKGPKKFSLHWFENIIRRYGFGGVNKWRKRTKGPVMFPPLEWSQCFIVRLICQDSSLHLIVSAICNRSYDFDQDMMNLL